jgi:predicted nuclease of restriction endonuclease-like (RecB) superfamily
MSPKEAEFVLELLDGFLVVPREKVNEDERDYLNR